MNGKRKHFTLSDFEPISGEPAPASGGTVATALGIRLADFAQIYVQSPQHRAVFAAYDALRLGGLASRGQRQYAVRNASLSGSGKTTAAMRFRDHVVRLGQHGPGDEPVVVLPLDRACTSRRLWASVCDHFGDAHSDKGKEETLRKRAYKCLSEFNVQLLIIDEVQHLSFRSSERNDVTDALKRTLDDGIVPLVFSGTEDARPMLVRNIQLSLRMHPPCDIQPLDPKSGSDRADFTQFLRRFDAEMVNRALVKQHAGLDDARVVAAMFEISSGVVGRAVMLLRIAYSRAFRRGADLVELCDLSAAAQEWAVPQGIIDHDPFRSRLR